MRNGHLAVFFSPPRHWARVPILLLLALLPAATAGAAPGSLVANVPLPVQGFGVSVASDCNAPLPNIYYTLANDTLLYITNKTGVLVGTRPIRTAAGALVVIDEMAFDGGTGLLYGVEHNSNPEKVWIIDPVSGLATFDFTSVTNSLGTFRDGLAFDASDNSFWISGDVSTTIEHYTAAGGFINQITPKDASGGTLGAISGVQTGIGDQLYLGQNGLGVIVRVKKSDGSFISSFASPGGRDEGLECDPISFSPTLVLWSRGFEAPGSIDAIELEPGTCACGGATPAVKTTWGSVKARYR